MKKLLLINPVGRRSGYLLTTFGTFSPLGLAYVAGATPDNWDVEILDENFDTFSYKEADLVGISSFTSNINRAYELAAIYRSKGTKVIMGGIHVSMMPDEALQYVDAVVIGEVEGVWKQVLKDFEAGSLQPKYQSPQLDLSKFDVLPRRDLLHPNYFWHSIQTSRGCPFNCHFCSVSKYMGRGFRQRSPESVLNEMATIKGKNLVILDDNLVGYSPESVERAKTIFRGMVERGFNKRWFTQTSMNMTNDAESVKLAAESGCNMVLIGFESADPKQLKSMKKNINLKTGVDNYKKVVDIFHKYGVVVIGTFILGNDHESPAYYEHLSKFLLSSGIDIFQITMLTPLPGTDLMETLKSQGRLLYTNFPGDWEKYRFSYMVHRPEGVDIETIYKGMEMLKSNLYTAPRYQYRLVKSLFNLHSVGRFVYSLKGNETYKRGWLKSHYHQAFAAGKQQELGVRT